MNATWNNLNEAAQFHWTDWFGEGPFLIMEQTRLADRDCYHLHNGQRDMGWFEVHQIKLETQNQRSVA